MPENKTDREDGMTAKFPGTCRRCHQPINVGDEIDWKKGAGATHKKGVCQAQPLPEPTGDLKRAVDHLYKVSRDGKLTDFTQSLLSQYERSGRLSEKQIAAVTKRLDKPAGQPFQAPPSLPSGRYAVALDGNVVLVHVWHPRGKPEVQRIYPVQGHDDKGGAALRGIDELKVAKAIAADPAKAAIEFGRRTGHCYRCGAELDVNLSKSMAVGPTCAKHVMDDETRLEMMAEHRAHIRSHGFDPNERNDDFPPLHGSRRAVTA
jgi:hypothetical protein